MWRHFELITWLNILSVCLLFNRSIFRIWSQCWIPNTCPDFRPSAFSTDNCAEMTSPTSLESQSPESYSRTLFICISFLQEHKQQFAAQMVTYKTWLTAPQYQRPSWITNPKHWCLKPRLSKRTMNPCIWRCHSHSTFNANKSVWSLR